MKSALRFISAPIFIWSFRLAYFDNKVAFFALL
ncbi:Uncharacterised protein [Chryseobacterium gleum]|uniref:Uncharacterized protein n=1 Tax=Chryseobacterium gleum TaxID=250 RepID=A0A448BAS3_CHRGE|nr:Uncharacterised protein [Chryseobacterium gleum]